MGLMLIMDRTRDFWKNNILTVKNKGGWLRSSAFFMSKHAREAASGRFSVYPKSKWKVHLT